MNVGGAPRRWAIPASLEDLQTSFGTRKPLVGMVHLEALPGSPRWGGSMRHVLARARADADTLIEGGMDGLLVENFGDVPFGRGRVPAETVAAFALALAVVIEEAGGRPVGVNVLRNDARSAIGLAAATGAGFIRINVLAGAMYTDQGWIEGEAHDLLRARAGLAPDLLLMADVLVKHAVPPPGIEPSGVAADLRERALADALIVSGARTGGVVDPARATAVKEAVPEAPLWLGSGLHPGNAAELMEIADGAIVGSTLREDGRAGAPVEAGRVRELVRAARG